MIKGEYWEVDAQASLSPKGEQATEAGEIVERRLRLLDIINRAGEKLIPGPDAAHSADFLYGDDGLSA